MNIQASLRTSMSIAIIALTPVLTQAETNISVMKAQTPASPRSGDLVSYAIMVTNTGTATLTGMTVTDTVSPVITGVTMDQPAGWAPPWLYPRVVGTQYCWSRTGFSMSPGTTYTFTISGTVGAVGLPTLISNTAYVTAGASFISTQKFSNGTAFVLAPTLPIDITAVQYGNGWGPGKVEYQIVVSNTGAATVTSMMVVDTISPSTTYVTTEQSAAFGPPTLTQAAGGTRYVWSAQGITMTSGESFTFTITGILVAIDTGCSDVTNTRNSAWIEATDGGAGVQKITNSVGGTGFWLHMPRLSASASQIPAGPDTGETLTYQVVATNTGNYTIESLTVVDTISPVIVDAVTSQPAGFGAPVVTSAGGSGTRYIWSASGLIMPPGGSYTFTITGTVGLACAAWVSNMTYVTGGTACGESQKFAGLPGWLVEPAWSKREITTAAGTGSGGYSGDGGAATTAQLASPAGVAVDSAGNLFIADESNHRIRKVDTLGVITTVAGGGTGGLGDGGPATSAQITYPTGVAVDSSGNLYIASGWDHRIRKVDTCGVITTVAGTGIEGYSGDGGAATSAQLVDPTGIAVDSSGNLYIADTVCTTGWIRKVDTLGVITTIAGGGKDAIFDGGPATSARLVHPTGVAVDSAGNLYIADSGIDLIRKVDTSGMITYVAGSGDSGYSGDGGAATTAKLYLPSSVAVDSTSNLYT